MRNEHGDAYIEGPTSANVVKERRPRFYSYVPDGNDASDYVLIRLNRKGDRREFQIGSFGGVSGGKTGVPANTLSLWAPACPKQCLAPGEGIARAALPRVASTTSVFQSST